MEFTSTEEDIILTSTVMQIGNEDNYTCRLVAELAMQMVGTDELRVFENPAPLGHPDHMDIGDYHTETPGDSLAGEVHIDRAELGNVGLLFHEAFHKAFHYTNDASLTSYRESQAQGWQQICTNDYQDYGG